MKETSYDIEHRDGKFQLADISLGEISNKRFIYICDAVKMNRKRLDYMLTQSSDWSEQECHAAHQEIVGGSEFPLATSESAPRG